jgi:general secretion pathway protein D
VPVAVQSAVSVTDPDAPVVNSIEYRDTGVILEVAPRVNAGGMVVLEIRQEVSDVVETTTSTLDSPTIRQRQIESTVAIKSGQTVALGGLIRQNNTEGVSGIPLLSDIPWVGNLFKTTSDVTDRTELLVLLTPRVVEGEIDAQKVTEELKSRMRSVDFIDATTKRY